MLKEYLYNEIKNYLKSIAKDTYVISILINFNECNVYDKLYCKWQSVFFEDKTKYEVILCRISKN